MSNVSTPQQMSFQGVVEKTQQSYAGYSKPVLGLVIARTASSTVMAGAQLASRKCLNDTCGKPVNVFTGTVLVFSMLGSTLNLLVAVRELRNPTVPELLETETKVQRAGAMTASGTISAITAIRGQALIGKHSMTRIGRASAAFTAVVTAGQLYELSKR